MTTTWLLLLLLILSSQSINSQSTTDADETCAAGNARLMSTMERMLEYQQQILEQHQTIINRLGKFQFQRVKSCEALALSYRAVKTKPHVAMIYRSGDISERAIEFDLTHCVRSNSVVNLDLDPSLVSDFRL